MQMNWIEMPYEKLTFDHQKLIDSAILASKNAYNVYSQFYVGAAVLTKTGNIFSSCNMENASYGLSICAEPGAIQSAISAADPEIISITIAGGKKGEASEEITTPCGRCRQIIFESSQISGVNIAIILTDLTKSKIILTDIESLLPKAFGPHHLKMHPEIENFKGSLKQS